LSLLTNIVPDVVGWLVLVGFVRFDQFFVGIDWSIVLAVSRGDRNCLVKKKIGLWMSLLSWLLANAILSFFSFLLLEKRPKCGRMVRQEGESSLLALTSWACLLLNRIFVS
jgi:hypothetical protein